MSQPRTKRPRTPRKTPPGVKPQARKLNAAQMVKHRAMVARMHDQKLLVAEAEQIQADWNLYSLQLQKELGLKTGQTVDEEGRVVDA